MWSQNNQRLCYLDLSLDYNVPEIFAYKCVCVIWLDDQILIYRIKYAYTVHTPRSVHLGVFSWDTINYFKSGCV